MSTPEIEALASKILDTYLDVMANGTDDASRLMAAERLTWLLQAHGPQQIPTGVGLSSPFQLQALLEKRNGG